MRRLFVQSWIVALLPLVVGATDQLQQDFANPPPDYRPHTWWHWMNGNVTKEGITADLEAMARIGVGAAQVFNVAQGEAPGSATIFTPEWRDLTQFAIREADRLGLQLAFHNCAGWSESGGPWVKPEGSMQKVVWSEVEVQGPGSLAILLKQPETIQGFYRDIAVYAFPTLPGDDLDLARLNSIITASVPKIDGQALVDDDPDTVVTLPRPNEKRPQYLQLEFPQPVALGSVCVQIRGADERMTGMTSHGWVDGSDDGQTFRKLADLPDFIYPSTAESETASFAETRTRFVRIVLTGSHWAPQKLEISGVALGGPRLSSIEQKAGYSPNMDVAMVGDDVPAKFCIESKRVIALTSKMKADGQLQWKAPKGKWTIVRLGHTSTGKDNAPAPEAGRGLECDKMSRPAVEAHFAAMMGKLIAAAGPLAGKSLKWVLADSWEARCQNWTPKFRAEFQKRRGYDPLPWLPVLTGRALNSAEESERFLWDFRRTIGDLIAEHHYAVFQELCHEHGMEFTAEAPGIGMPTIAEQLQCKKYTDVPMGEFWIDGHNDSREPASAAHIYGRKVASAEAFTAGTKDAKWTKTPFDHKALGDLNFCRGINRYVFHRYAMQPWTNRAPGMTMGPWGTNFERTNTWWEKAKAWMQYIARCQFLLQQGLFVADIAYFYGEGAPTTITKHEPTLPPGYDFDAVNADVLLNRMQVKDGRLVLPDGMSYRLLLLPESTRMTPDVLRKINDLVEAGATVVGPRPERSPSLTDYPACDKQVRKLANNLWGKEGASRLVDRKAGAGRVISGRPLERVLPELCGAPDVAAEKLGSDYVYIHRRVNDTDLYFVSSQLPSAAHAAFTFRAGARRPELWHPDNGRMEPAVTFTETNGLVTVPLDFDPAGSVFIVFRAPLTDVESVVALLHKERDLLRMPLATANSMPTYLTAAEQGWVLHAFDAGRYEVKTARRRTLDAEISGLPEPLTLSGPWVLRFPAGWGAPAQVTLDKLISWTEYPDEGVKHFSGTATYEKEFELPADWFTMDHAFWLDLGVVKEVAEVHLNGKSLGIRWKPPFRLDISSALQPGKNKLAIEVVNLWPNRLIGDAALPADKRVTWAQFQPYKPKDPLLPSGLLGPVAIQTEAQFPIGP